MHESPPELAWRTFNITKPFDPNDDSRTPENWAIPPALAEHPDYENIREVGRGGQGVVYVALNRIMARNEALKLIRPSLRDRPETIARFHREIRIVARLHHENVITGYCSLHDR